MNIALAIILFSGYAFAGIIPLSSDNQKTIDSNFEELALEVQRQSLKQGGTATQNVKFSSSVQVTGGAVFSGTTKHDGVTTFNAQIISASTATFSASTMIGPQIIQAWAHFTGTGTFAIMDGVGVTSITAIATGRYRVNLSTPFANVFYAVSCTPLRGGNAGCDEGVATTKTVGAVELYTHTNDGAAADMNRINFMAVGRR